PDVGAGYFLNKAPGYYGRYLALSGETINGNDAIFINAADYLIPSERVNDVLNIIKERSEEHTSELQSRFELVCRLLLEKKIKRNPLTISPRNAGTLTPSRVAVDCDRGLAY